MRSNKISIAALLLAFTALSACDLRYPYEKPETPPLPSAWDQSGGDETTPNAWPDKQWWAQFKSPELTNFMQEALSANDDLAAAVDRVREANAQVMIAGAPLLPTVDATAAGTRSTAPDKSRPPTRAYGKSFNAGVTASYELDFWGKNRSALNAQEALLSANIYDKQTVLLTVTSSVATTYFDWLATRQRLDVAHENLAVSQRMLASLNRQFQGGIVSRLDVAQQENVVATVQAAIPPLELEATQDRNALAILLGRMPESMPEPEGKFNDLALPKVPAGLPSQLLARRPDVLESEADLESAHASVNEARAAFFPSISLTSTLDTASSALSNLLKPGSVLFSYGANLTQPIFHGGALSGQLEFAHAQEDEYTANYHKAILNAFADTENALAALQRTKEQDMAEAQAEKAAKDAFALSQRQFQGGTIDILTELNVQRSLFSATDARVQTQLAHLNAIVGVYKALGGGWVNHAAAPERRYPSLKKMFGDSDAESHAE